MPYRLSWLPEALTDLVRLREFIHVHNPAACRTSGQPYSRSRWEIADYPLIGKSVDGIDDLPLRELFISA